MRKPSSGCFNMEDSFQWFLPLSSQSRLLLHHPQNPLPKKIVDTRTHNNINNWCLQLLFAARYTTQNICWIKLFKTINTDFGSESWQRKSLLVDFKIQKFFHLNGNDVYAFPTEKCLCTFYTTPWHSSEKHDYI